MVFGCRCLLRGVGVVVSGKLELVHIFVFVSVMNR
jgi:hypothetical protein